MNQTVFIGCSASDDVDDIYLDMARRVACALSNAYDLTFGGVNRGPMGQIYQVFHDKKRKIVGVAPYVYQKDFQEIDCTYEMATENTTEKLGQLIEYADAFIFLPGGMGTLTEFFTCLDEKRTLGFHEPIILYNENHYFDYVLLLFQKMYKEKFSSSEIENLYHVVSSVDELMMVLDNHFKKGGDFDETGIDG